MNNSRKKLAAIAVLVAELIFASLANAAIYSVSIDTTALAGANVHLAFDLIDGGPPANSILITSFATDGTLGAQSGIGGVSGALPGPVTFSDTDFFNELLVDLVLGTSLSFDFAPAQNVPDPGSLPDAFSVLLLDPVSGLPLFPTADPTGADTLLLFGIDGSATGALKIFQTPGQEVRISVIPRGHPVPEPGTLALLSIGMLWFIQSRRQRC